MESYKKFVAALNAVGKWICIASLTTMTALIALQVIFRYVIQSSLSFSEELARYAFIWSAFVGAALALKNRSHVSIEIIVANLPRVPKKWAIGISNAVSFVFYAVMLVFGAVMTFETKDQTSPAMGLSMAFVYLAVPVAGLILMANVVVNAYNELSNPDIVKSEGVE